MENRSYEELIGPPGSVAETTAPFLNQIAANCGLAVNYHNITHPSLPNYLAATSGNTYGVRSNCRPTECGTPDSNIFADIEAAGLDWQFLAESMPAACSAHDTTLYGSALNAPLYYSSLNASCVSNDLPLGTPSSGPLASELRANALPSFAFVIPNACNNTHNCQIATGDQWLRSWVTTITSSEPYRSGEVILFVTWDEGEGGANLPGQDCSAPIVDASCHVALLALSPYVPAGLQVLPRFDHFALHHITEGLLGIGRQSSSALELAYRLHLLVPSGFVHDSALSRKAEIFMGREFDVECASKRRPSTRLFDSQLAPADMAVPLVDPGSRIAYLPLTICKGLHGAPSKHTLQSFAANLLGFTYALVIATGTSDSARAACRSVALAPALARDAFGLKRKDVAALRYSLASARPVLPPAARTQC